MACQGRSAPAPTVEAKPVSVKAVHFDGARALDHVLAQVAFGPRIPESTASQKTTSYIESHLKALGWQVQRQPFTATTPKGNRAMENIVAVWPVPSSKAIAFGAHYDTKVMENGVIPGANDGASGVAVLLELARILASNPPQKTIALFFLDGEEAFEKYDDTDGLYGSRYLSQNLPLGLKESLTGVVIVDMVGDEDLNIMIPSNSDSFLASSLLSVAKRTGFEPLSAGRMSVLDDHVPFAKAGYPAVVMIDFEYGPDNSYWHTAADTPDHVSAESMEKVGRFLADFVSNSLGKSPF